jgi:hypothetical protein
MKGGATPFFFHAYGNTFKEKSGFEWRSKQGKFLSAIFSMGPKEYEQSKFLGIRQERTGGSKLDLFTFPEIFKVPVKKPFVLYCSTISNTRIYPKELSEPEKWAPYLEDIFNSTGFEFVAKWHPNSTQKFKKMKLVKNTYLPTYQYDVLRQANIIVADPTSLLPDALIVNKPLFLIKTPLDEWGYYRRFKKGCYMIVGNRQKDRGLILKVMNKDWLKNERKKLIKEWWYKPDGNASERVWKQISKLV